MRKALTYISILMLLLSSCDKDNVQEQVESTLVVQGVLVAGESVNNIRIATLKNSQFEQASTGVSGAEVIIKRGSVEYELSESTTETGVYEYIGDELEIISGGNYLLEIKFEDEVVSANTQVPGAIVIDEIGNTNIIVDTMSFGEAAFELTWEEMTPYLALLSLESIDDEPVEIPFIVDNGTFDFFYSKPIQELQATILDIDFEFYGQNRLSAYSIHSEYEKLFLNLRQLNGELFTEGSDNIQGGVGYFTSVSRTSVIINVE